MRASRFFLWFVLLAIVALFSWYWVVHGRSNVGDRVTVYYTAADGKTEVPWIVSMRAQQSGESAAEHVNNAALYAATQAVAGPPSNISAVRFPAGTHVLAASVNGPSASVDLSGEVKNQTGGVLDESAEFKSLVWTLTALPGVDRVAVRVLGQTLQTLPGGHLELDEPLRRSDW